MPNSTMVKLITILLPSALLLWAPSGSASGDYQWTGKEEKNGWVSTAQTLVTPINDHHFSVQDGAVVVKAGANNLFLSTPTADGRLICRLAPGVQALFESRTGKNLIVNLSNRCCGAVLLYMPSVSKPKLIMPLEQSVVSGSLQETSQLDAQEAVDRFHLKDALNESALTKVMNIGGAPAH